MIENGLYDLINRKIYAQTNAPITMRLGMNGGPYFSPMAESSVPTDVLALPRDWMDDMQLHDEFETHNVFVLKPEHSYVLNQSVAIEQRFDDHNVNLEK